MGLRFAPIHDQNVLSVEINRKNITDVLIFTIKAAKATWIAVLIPGSGCEKRGKTKRSRRIIAMRSRVIRAALTAESPRVTIAKNVLKFQALKAATNEAALEAAAKSSPHIDVNALPAEIAGLKSYLSSAPAATGEGFKKDPTAWQNMSFGAYVPVEAARDNTWPFVAGGM